MLFLYMSNICGTLCSSVFMFLLGGLCGIVGYWYNLVYITFSRIFEEDESKEIGIKLVISSLSPFLCKGFISENFNWEGKIPDGSDLLQMCVRWDVMKGGLTFRIFIGIPSYAWEFFAF